MSLRLAYSAKDQVNFQIRKEEVMGVCKCCGGTGKGKIDQPNLNQEPCCLYCHGTGYAVDGGNS
jgi:Zn finger protein HypA/HybF involved in hydrogenase expression